MKLGRPLRDGEINVFGYPSDDFRVHDPFDFPDPPRDWRSIDAKQAAELRQLLWQADGLLCRAVARAGRTFSDDLERRGWVELLLALEHSVTNLALGVPHE